MKLTLFLSLTILVSYSAATPFGNTVNRKNVDPASFDYARIQRAQYNPKRSPTKVLKHRQLTGPSAECSATLGCTGNKYCVEGRCVLPCANGQNVASSPCFCDPFSSVFMQDTGKCVRQCDLSSPGSSQSVNGGCQCGPNSILASNNLACIACTAPEGKKQPDGTCLLLCRETDPTIGISDTVNGGCICLNGNGRDSSNVRCLRCDSETQVISTTNNKCVAKCLSSDGVQNQAESGGCSSCPPGKQLDSKGTSCIATCDLSTPGSSQSDTGGCICGSESVLDSSNTKCLPCTAPIGRKTGEKTCLLLCQSSGFQTDEVGGGCICTGSNGRDSSNVRCVSCDANTQITSSLNNKCVAKCLSSDGVQNLGESGGCSSCPPGKQLDSKGTSCFATCDLSTPGSSQIDTGGCQCGSESVLDSSNTKCISCTAPFGRKTGEKTCLALCQTLDSGSTDPAGGGCLCKAGFGATSDNVHCEACTATQTSRGNKCVENPTCSSSQYPNGNGQCISCPMGQKVNSAQNGCVCTDKYQIITADQTCGYCGWGEARNSNGIGCEDCVANGKVLNALGDTCVDKCNIVGRQQNEWQGGCLPVQCQLGQGLSSDTCVDCGTNQYTDTSAASGYRCADCQDGLIPNLQRNGCIAPCEGSSRKTRNGSCCPEGEHEVECNYNSSPGVRATQCVDDRCNMCYQHWALAYPDQPETGYCANILRKRHRAL